MAPNRGRTGGGGSRANRGGGGAGSSVDAGLRRAAATLDRLAARINASFRPLAQLTATVATSYARIAQSTARIAGSLKSAVDSLKQLSTRQGGGASGGESAARVATGAAAGAAEGAASFAASAAMPKLWAMMAGSSASMAASTAATSTAITASTSVSSMLSATLASSASAAGGVLAALGPVLPIVLAIGAAGVAIYSVWKELDSIWPGIASDLATAAKWLVELGVATARLLNPWTYIKGAVNLVGRAVGAVRDGVVAAANAVKGLLVGAANMAVSAWQKLSGLVAATASRVGAVVRSTGSELATLGATAAAGIGAARDVLASMLEKLAYAGVAVAGLGAAIVGPLTIAAQRFGEAGDAIDRLAKRAGASAEVMSELAYAAERTGVSTTQLADAISAVGGEQAFLRLANEIGAIADPLQRAAAAKEAFGNAGRSLMPLLDQGPAGLEAMRKEANALGLTFSGPAAASASALARSYQLLKDGLQGLWQTIGQAVGPAIEDWNQLLVGAIKGAVSWAKANQPLIAQVFRVAEAAATAGAAVAAIASTIMPAIPLVLGLTSAAAAGWAVWGKYGQSVMAVVGPIITSVQELYAEVERVFGGIGDAIRAGELELAVQIAWLGIQTAWAAGLAAVADMTSGAFAGIADALAAGDWQSAGQQAWAQVQIVFEQGVGEIEALWVRLRIGIDSVVTHVRQAWNSALDGIGTQLDKLIAGTAKMLASVSSYDMTGQAAKAAEALHGMGTLRGNASGENAALGAAADERRKAIEADAAASQESRDSRIEDLRKQAATLATAAASAADPVVADLQKRLDDALAKAAALRAQSDADGKAAALKIEQRVREGGVEGVKRSSSGATFSASALVAMAARGETKLEKIGQQQLAKLDEQIAATRDLADALRMEFVA